MREMCFWTPPLPFPKTNGSVESAAVHLRSSAHPMYSVARLQQMQADRRPATKKVHVYSSGLTHMAESLMCCAVLQNHEAWITRFKPAPPTGIPPSKRCAKRSWRRSLGVPGSRRALEPVLRFPALGVR